jgi:uncharacterized ferritin-like protein (DUF455 family)
MGPDIIVVRGVPLRRDPARDECFVIVTDQADMIRVNDDSERSQREKLHVELNAELQSLEIAAQSIADFPDAPWQLRLDLARQCWDETRHARLCHQRLIQKGGRKGEFPIINQEWGVVCAFDSLLARLVVQNRTFEAGSLDVMLQMVAWWSERGDRETAEHLDGIQADEIGHVRMANLWIERLTRDNPRATAEAAAALANVRQRLGRLQSPRPGQDQKPRVDLVVPANSEDRRRAGFSDDAVDALARRAASDD